MALDLTKPLIMGILNVTPDSFSDGGKFNECENALKHALQMAKDGATIIDIGGESTRPNSEPVSASEQIARVIPVIQVIRKHSDILISIDTTLSVVAKAALDAGANIINDVSAGRGDDQMFNLAATKNVPIILMHAQGNPQTMQDNPYYENVVQEIKTALLQRANLAISAGVKKENIVLDIGIGFGKRKQDNLDLLAHLSEFTKLDFPILLGTSRKRFMGVICDVTAPSELVIATAVTTAIGIMAGVQIFRVHDVKENKQALDLALAIKSRRI